MARRVASLLSIAALVAAGAPVLMAAPASAATFPAGFTDTTVAASISNPAAVTQLPDGQVLVASQGGTLTKVTPSTGAKVEVLSLGVCTGSEQGLLGVAPNPAYATNGQIFVYYTVNPGGGCVNRVSSFTFNGTTFGNEQILLDNFPTFGNSNHNGGFVGVGKDGKLYVSVGDGGGSQSSNAGQNKSHDLSYPNGKILRVNLDGSVPADNPYGTTACKTTWGVGGQTCGEVYAIGLRNPFRLAFRADGTETTFRILDVGDSTWEEIDEGAAKADYGWPQREGPCTIGSTTDCGPPPAGVTNPISWYRTASPNCSITGGGLVPAGAWAGYEGAFVFADLCAERIYVQRAGQTGADFTELGTGTGSVIDMQFALENSVWVLYYVTRTAAGGELHRVVGPAAVPTLPPQTDLKFTPVAPTRLLDSRTGTGTGVGKLKPGTTISLQIIGSVVPVNARAVVLNLTATLADGPGFVTAYPTGQPQPPTSSLNLSTALETAANAVVVPVGVGGQVNLFSFGGTHLVADVTGYFSDVGSSGDGRFHTTAAPTRLLDTRTGTGGKSGRFGAGESYDLQVAGAGGVPASGATAVALTVTYTGPTAAGFLTVWPTGTPTPLVSTTNPNGPGDIRSNLALVQLGAGGKVSILSFQPTDVVIDVVGYFSPGTGASGLFTSIVPSRVADSRLPAAPFGRIAGGSEVTNDFTTVVSGGAGSALYNLTATNTVAGGYLTAHPAGTALPLASSVNWSGAQQHRAALTISSLSAAKKVSLFAFTDADAVVDLAGWFNP